MTTNSRFPRRPFLIALALAGVVAALGVAVAAATTTTPAGGSIHVLGTSSGLGGGGKVLITGAIGDHGTSNSANKNGKPSSNGSYVKLNLTQGTILLNKTKLDQAINHAYGSLVVNPATCSTAIAGSGTLPFVTGTGLYKGISGSARITVSVGFVLPRFTSGANAGKCNESNSGTPTGSLQLVQGTGTVSFH